MSSNFINDCISESDYLGYLPYIKAFEYIICNHTELMSLPVVFGVHGKWGVGKSTFLSLIKKNLNLTNNFFTIELNPWEYGNDNNFVATFLTKLYKEAENDLCNSEKKQDEIVATIFKSILKPFKITADLNLVKVEYDFSKLNFQNQKQIIDDFITENFAKKETIKFILDAEVFKTKKVVVFIDDLDRCPADKIMEVIESIKLVFNSENCIFFLGCDKEYLESALSLKYKDFIQFQTEEQNSASANTPYKSSLSKFSREYLEKIIQIPFNIPPLSTDGIATFIGCLIHPKQHKLSNHIEYKKNYYQEFKNNLPLEFITQLIVKANINPRRIKRILNLIFLNYIFIEFKSKEIQFNNNRVNLDLLSFLGFVKDVEQDFYRSFFSNTIICKRIFRNCYLIYQNNNGDNNDYEPDNYLVPANIIDYFKIFFEWSNITSTETLEQILLNIENYISVSNTTTLEEYKEKDWGSIGEIRSEISNKKVAVFLNRLPNSETIQDFVIWFFESIYNRKLHAIGIQRNIHFYKKPSDGPVSYEKDFLFRLEFNDKENILYIRFKRGNLNTAFNENINILKQIKTYDKSKKQIALRDDIDVETLNNIKIHLEKLVQKITLD